MEVIKYFKRANVFTSIYAQYKALCCHLEGFAITVYWAKEFLKIA